jgi:hypothetical protein
MSYAQLLTSAVRSATTNSAVQTNGINPAEKGVIIYVNVTAVPGVDTVTPKIQGQDAFGNFYDILVGTAISTTTTQILTVYPGIAVSANVSASTLLSCSWRVVMTHSAGSNFTYTVSACVKQ